MSKAVPLSSYLPLNPLEDSPPKVLQERLPSRAMLMKGIIHYKVFDLGMIYSPFPLSVEKWKPSLR